MERTLPTILIDGERDLGRGLNWSELWRHRELLYFLTWRDIALRYKQTALGVLWAIIYPLLSVGIFSLFFGRVAKLPSDGIPYPLFSFSGLLIWIYFANTVGRCSSSLVGNANMINKVYFPRLLLPVAAIFPGVVDFGIAACLLIGGMLFYGAIPSPAALIQIPLILLGTTGLSLGLGMFLGAVNVRYRDVNNGLSFLMQMWMFATPVVYPISLIREEYRIFAALNPMVGYVEAFRSALFNQAIDWNLFAVSAVITVVSLVVGTRYFIRVEKSFADIV